MSLEFCSVRYNERITHGYDSQEASKGNNPLIELIASNDWDNAIVQIDTVNAKTWSVSRSQPSRASRTEIFPIHQGCTRQNSVEIIDSSSHPSRASQTEIFPNHLGYTRKSSVQILPIHQACTKANVPVRFLEPLVAAYSKSLHMCDSADLRTPLHLALIAGTSEDVIFYLLGKCYSAASIQDHWGRTPLHYACANLASIAVIKELLLRCPETIRATDDFEWAPIHIASLHSCSTEAIDAMISLSPDVVFMLTKEGDTAITIAKQNTSQAKDLILARLYEVWNSHETPIYQNEREAYRQSPNDCCSCAEDNDFV